MKVLTASATNFQSYPELSFNYDNQGLCLIAGQTGAGKSTLMDLVPWVLFGTTSKEGAADSVRPWGNSGTTEGHIMVELPDGVIEVRRARSPNDLYWVEHGTSQAPQMPSDLIRGKDLTDTQKLLEKRLGVTADLFIAGSYLTQFSDADTFFIAKAKERREVLEKIADQSFAVSLGEKSAAARKEAKANIAEIEKTIANLAGKQETLEDLEKDYALSIPKWERDRSARLKAVKAKHLGFAAQNEIELSIIADTISTTEKNIKPREYFTSEIERLTLVEAARNDLVTELTRIDLEILLTKRKHANCPTCKRPMPEGDAVTQMLASLIKQREDLSAALGDFPEENQTVAQMQKAYNENRLLEHKLATLLEKFETVQSAQNPYAEHLTAIAEEVNPYIKKQESTITQLKDLTLQLKNSKKIQETLTHEYNSLSWLYTQSFALRGLLMQRAVSALERHTNTLLECYFDATLRIRLSLEGSDKLEVEVFNNSHSTDFKQLSGGERCILKLCFSVALMRAVQNKAGTHFDTIMLDEPMGGLDPDLKTKAFGLLQELEKEYSSVMVIEHSEELKQQFAKVFTVVKEGGASVLHE